MIFTISGVMRGREQSIKVEADSVEHALNQAFNRVCFTDEEFAGLVIEAEFTYNDKPRAGRVLEHGETWLKLDGNPHPKTFSLAKVG